MFETIIKEIFINCVYILQVIGGSPGEFGHGYYLANILIFVVLQPSLILLFFWLWRKERWQRKNLSSH
jgi:NADH:ubiquinone oxidoreductase subunit 3 (subunit A)